MKRAIEAKLKAWDAHGARRPLLLSGARQVGKTYSLKSFGRQHFDRVHYFNFEEDSLLCTIFDADFRVQRILEELSFRSGQSIRPGKDLLILDEIQECPRAITSLKYFQETLPNQAVACAGSLIGVKLSETSFPVGQVDYLWMGPMTFSEFLGGIGDDTALDALASLREAKRGSAVVHQHLWDRTKEYFVVGGMPGIVSWYQRHRKTKAEAFSEVRRFQTSLIRDYSADFAKHSGKLNSVHIQGVFENIPQQLSQCMDASVKRYRFSHVLPNKKSYAELAGPIHWLIQAGLAIRVSVCNKAEVPLNAFTQPNRFKLYLFDIGLLGAMLQIPPESLIRQDYGSTKGFFAENLVAQALHGKEEDNLFAWHEGTSEIEFLRVQKGQVIPLEVKSGLRTKAKSLSVFRKKYRPPHVIKCSAQALKINEAAGQHSYPLYLAEYL